VIPLGATSPVEGLTLGPGLVLPVEAVTETFAILAKHGAGKTYTAAVLVEEMMMMMGAGLPVTNTASDPGMQQQIKQGLAPGETAAKIAATFRVKGAPAASFTTPASTSATPPTTTAESSPFSPTCATPSQPRPGGRLKRRAWPTAPPGGDGPGQLSPRRAPRAIVPIWHVPNTNLISTGQCISTSSTCTDALPG